MISWMSKKKKLIALTIAEEKYIVASNTSCEVVWLRKLLGELFGKVLDTALIYCDNKSMIYLEKNH